MNIFASKLYRFSNRKDKIRAAIENPINLELVTQLRSYLDDKYLTNEYFPDTGSASVEDDKTDQNAPPSESRDSAPVRHSDFGSRSTSFSPGDLDLDDEAPNEDTDIVVDEDVVDTEEEDTDTDVEEATSITDTPISSATSLYVPPQVDTNILSSIIPQIKGTLNSRDDTCGVDNIFVKDKELWIYYNDSVNLNNVMTTVIEILNSTGYYYLSFSRLARKDNAMVFDIVLSDKYVEPVEVIEDEEK